MAVSSGGSGEGSGAPSDEHDNLSDQETPEVVPHVDVAFVDQVRAFSSWLGSIAGLPAEPSVRLHDSD